MEGRGNEAMGSVCCREQGGTWGLLRFGRILGRQGGSQVALHKVLTGVNSSVGQGEDLLCVRFGWLPAGLLKSGLLWKCSDGTF